MLESLGGTHLTFPNARGPAPWPGPLEMGRSLTSGSLLRVLFVSFGSLKGIYKGFYRGSIRVLYGYYIWVVLSRLGSLLRVLFYKGAVLYIGDLKGDPNLENYPYEHPTEKKATSFLDVRDSPGA